MLASEANTNIAFVMRETPYNDSLDIGSFYTAPEIPEWIWLLSSGILLFIVSVAIVSNVTIIIAYCRTKWLQKDFYRLLMNLIFADLIMASIGIPIDIIANFQHGWKMNIYLCNFCGFVHTFTGMASIYTLTALSINRWWQTYFRYNESTFKSVLDTISRYLTPDTVIFLVWFMAFSIAVSPILGWSYYHPETNGFTCIPAWTDPNEVSFACFLLIVGFTIPNLIIINTSVSVYQNHNRHYEGMSSGESVAEIGARREKKVTRMLILMVFAFNLSWSPYAIICFLDVLQLHIISPIWNIPVLILAKSSCCWNPIIYVFLNTQFRNAIFSTRSRGILGDEKRRDEIAKMMAFQTSLIRRATLRAASIKINPLFQYQKPSSNDLSKKKYAIDENEIENLKFILGQVIEDMRELSTPEDSLRTILNSVMIEDNGRSGYSRQKSANGIPTH